MMVFIFRVAAILLVVFTASGLNCVAQSWKGYPNIKNYTIENAFISSTYDQNWAIIQDDNNVLYVANGDGVLTFNGFEWRLIKLRNNNYPYTLAQRNDTIYVGGQNEMGFLSPNQNGSLIYTSLVKEFLLEDNEIGVVRQVVCNEQGCFFLAKNKLFIWSNGKFEIIEAQNEFNSLDQINDEILVSERGLGVGKLVDGKISFGLGSNYLNKSEIRAISPITPEQLLVTTRSSGLFLMNSLLDKIERLNTEVDTLLNNIDAAEINPDDSLIYIATNNHGLITLNFKGELMSRFNSDNILPADNVNKLFIDHRGSLWCSSNSFGLLRMDVSSPVTYLKKTGKSRKINTVSIVNDTLLLGTSKGIASLETENGQWSLKETLNDKNNCWKFLKTKKSLLAAMDDGIYQFENNDWKKIVDLKYALSFFISSDSSRILVGHQGLTILSNQDEQLTPTDSISHPQFFEYVMSDGNKLWLNTHSGLIASLDLDQGDFNENVTLSSLKFYTETDGLPIEPVIMYSLKDELVLRIKDEKRMYVYDYDSNQFVEDSTILSRLFGAEFEDFVPISSLDNEGNFWVVRKGASRDCVFIKNNGLNDFSFIEDLDQEAVYNNVHFDYDKAETYISHHQDLIFNGQDGLLFYRLGLDQHLHKSDSVKIMISKISTGNDSLIYGGYGNIPIPEFDYYNTGFKIKYALSEFKDAKSIEFQYQLIEGDGAWSKWSTNNFKEYSNLREGDYSFLVRARLKDQMSPIINFDFTILPPIQRTWQAYVLYVIILFLLLFFILKWRLHRITLRRKFLERQVEVRTNEVVSQNELLTKQSKQLSEQAEKLEELDEMKALFFANISHELKTPLTLIMAVIEKYQAKDKFDIKENRVKTDFDILNRNTDRLKLLIDQILELSSLESGMVILNKTEGDIMTCIKKNAESFLSLAEKTNIHYTIKIDSEFYCLFDKDKIDKIVTNLLSNAFKFTHENGNVFISVHYVDNGLEIVIKDDAHGIPASEINKIFERFYRVKNSDFEGTGIGLTLVKELVELHNGKINVDSKEGEGSTFTIFLPYQPIERVQKSGNLINEYEQIPSQPLSEFEKSEEFFQLDDELPTILIVEDNLDLRSFIKNSLENNFRIVVAANGASGKRMAFRDIPDLIILDRMLPDQDGIELCALLKNDMRTSHIPIVMLTAKTDLDSVIEGMEEGADDYIKKPFKMVELIARIKNILDQRQRLKLSWTNTTGIEFENYKSKDKDFLKSVVGIVEDKLQDSNFNVVELQKGIGMSRMQLHRKLTNLVDVSAADLIRNIRLQRAKKMLEREANISVSEVAYEVGFSDPSYFSKVFRKYFNESPSKFVS